MPKWQKKSHLELASAKNLTEVYFHKIPGKFADATVY